MGELHYDKLSGGPLLRFRGGWALMPFIGSRAHKWIEDTTTMPPTIVEGGRGRYFRALCGVLAATTPKVPAVEEGNWPRCKRCQGKERKS